MLGIMPEFFRRVLDMRRDPVHAIADFAQDAIGDPHELLFHEADVRESYSRRDKLCNLDLVHYSEKRNINCSATLHTCKV